MTRSQKVTLTEVWRRLILNFTDGFEGFRTSVEKVTVNVEIARELEVEPEDD